MAPSTVNDTMREMMAAIRRWFGRWHGIDESEALISSGGTSTAITVTYSNAPASLFTGLECGFKVTTTCGAAPTLNVNGLGAKNIQKFVDGAYVNLAAGDIVATQHIKVKYDGTLDKWILWGQQLGQRVSFFAHKNGTDQTGLTSGAATKVTFGTESWDTGGYFASSTWTPPAGKYRITASVRWLATNGVADELLVTYIYKNGAILREHTAFRNTASAVPTVAVSVIADANGTDTFEVYAGKFGAGNGDVSGGATHGTFFCGEEI